MVDRHTEVLQLRLPGGLHERLPVSELVELDGVGHVPSLEDPWRLHRVRSRFLAGLPTGSS